MKVRNDTQDTLHGLTAIKLQGAEEWEVKRYERKVTGLLRAERKMGTAESIHAGSASCLFWCAFACNLALAYAYLPPADFMLVFILSANLQRKLMDAMEQLIACLGKFEELEDLWEAIFIEPLPLLTPPLPLEWLPYGQSIGMSGSSGAGQNQHTQPAALPDPCAVEAKWFRAIFLYLMHVASISLLLLCS
jgi:hypothetical protein